VAYFTKNQALKGSRDFNAQHNGVVYYFASEADRKPVCRVAGKVPARLRRLVCDGHGQGAEGGNRPGELQGHQRPTLPVLQAFYGNALKDWIKDEPSLTTKADANWKKIAGE